MTSTTITTEGLDVHVVDDAGGDPPLVLVHSSGLSSRQWVELRRTLAGTHRLLAPDLIGYGRSTAWERDGRSPIEVDAAVVGAVLEHAGGRCVLVGHSYGGFLALKAALAHPTSVAGIVLHEPVAWGVLYSRGEKELIRQFESVDDDGLFFDPVRGGGDAWCERFIDFWSGAGAWRSMQEERRAAFLRVGGKVFDEVRELCADRTPHETYRDVTARSIITCGETSPPMEQRVCEILAGSLPNAELRRIPGGHMGPITHARPFIDAIADMALAVR